MADFLLLFRGGDMEMQPSPEKRQAQQQQWIHWMGNLNEAGKLVGAQPLKPGGKVVSGSSKTVTSGPFMEGREMVNGYLICKAGSLDEAVEISKGCPVLESGNGMVEVREIREMEI